MRGALGSRVWQRPAASSAANVTSSMGEKPATTEEQRTVEMAPTREKSLKEVSARKLLIGEHDVVEVLPESRRSGRLHRPLKRLSYHACLLPATFSTLHDNAKANVDLPKLDPDMHADPEHRWDIATITAGREGLHAGVWRLLRRDVSVAEDIGDASASAKRRSGKGKGGKGSGGGSGSGGGGSGSSGGGSSGGGDGDGTGGGSGGSGGGGGGSGGSGGGGGSGNGGGGTGAQRVGSGGGQRQQQQRRNETQLPQQLCDGRLHTQHGCFSCLDDAWCAEFGDDVELPRWADLLRSMIAIFDLDFDAILSAMYALSVSAEGDCYRCVPPDQGIAATALSASESGTLPGTAPVQALHTFTLDSGASHYFFHDSTTLTPLHAPIPVRLADPSGGPVVARSSTVLPCPAVPSSSLSGLHLPSFSTNLVSTAALQDAMVTTTTPGGQHMSICTCTRTGRHLTMFTRRPRSSLYTLANEPPQVAASAQVSALGRVAASCSSRLLSHQILLWHHRLGHPSLPRLRGMHSRLLVSGLPRSLPPLPPSPTPPCLPCVEGRQRAAPHSSFPPMIAPLQTLHMDVWGPARVSGQSRERYFLLVVDEYTR
ncbi:unnamed protein product, partial [Closterium sp. NIES-54]